MHADRDSEGGAASFNHLAPLHHQNPNPSPSPPSNGATKIIRNSNDGFSSSSNMAVHPNSVASSITASSSSPGASRKSGRPRKFGTPEKTAAAGSIERKRDAGTAASPSSPLPDKSQLNNTSSIGTMGRCFDSSIVTVAAGEDVRERILMFMMQSKQEINITSACGSVSDASLLQPKSSKEDTITYKGPFEILSLSGSYIHTNHGERCGGLSVSLSDCDGQIIGGQVGGPLTAAGPVQVIISTFLINVDKDTTPTKGVTGKSTTTPPRGNTTSHGTMSRCFGSSIVTVAAGEDVRERILMLMIQSNREICIMSACGSVSDASLLEPESSKEETITCKGTFEILSLSGSYIRTDDGGRSGGISVSLSNSDGQIFGGEVGGPLTAASPVQVVIFTFLIDVDEAATTPTKGLGTSSGKSTTTSPLTSHSGRHSSPGNDGTINIRRLFG